MESFTKGKVYFLNVQTSLVMEGVYSNMTITFVYFIPDLLEIEVYFCSNVNTKIKHLLFIDGC